MGIDILSIGILPKLNIYELTIFNISVGLFNRALFHIFHDDRGFEIEILFMRVKK